MKYLISIILPITLILSYYNSAAGNDEDEKSPEDYFYHPFSKESAFNRPIGTGAEYSDDESLLTTDIREVPRWGFNTRNGWGVAVAISTEKDPLVTVTCSSSDINRDINFPYQLRIPAGFPISVNVPETSDGQIVIYDSTTGYTHEFYKFKWNNGNPKADIHRTDDPNIEANPANPSPIRTYPEQSITTGTGHGSEPGKVIGTRAIGSACLAGLLRTFELTEPDIYPQHALALELAYGQLSHDYQWPAVAKDYTYYENSGNIPYGALVAIPPQSKGGPDLSTLGLSDAGMRIAKSLVHYGGIVTDRRGQNAGIDGDQYIPTSVVNDIQDDLQHKLIPHLRVITNNDKDQEYSGGGASLLDATTSASKNITNDQFKIYPNPASNQLNIEVAHPSEVHITDSSSRVILQKSVPQGATNLSINFKPGVYFVQLRNNKNNLYSSKIVVSPDKQ